MSATSEILSIHDLRLSHHNDTDLVKGLTLTIAHRQVLGLVGESGCGKSLTCLAVMGLLPRGIRQTSGQIRLNGHSLSDLAPHDWRSLRGRTLAMILQNPMSCFDPVFTIRHHFKETLAAHGICRREEQTKRMVDALVEVGLEPPQEILNLYPFQMSGGMLQRVMVALALLLKVSLLVADEPTTDLDVVSQASILELLSKVREKLGMSLLLVTHDLSVIARLADKMAVMRYGEIVETGSTTALFHNPRHPYTRSLIQAYQSLHRPRLQRQAEPSGWCCSTQVAEN